MKVINAAKEWNKDGSKKEIIYYYIEEHENSIEQLCKDVVVPALQADDEPFELDFSDFQVSGLGCQKASIMAFYLVRKAGFSAEELAKRVKIKAYDKHDASDYEEFLSSLKDASKKYLKFLTSNLNKIREFNRLSSTTDFIMTKGVDIREVLSDSLIVAQYKSLEAGSGTIIEDTVLEIDGSEVVDIRYRLDQINEMKEDKQAVWNTTLAVNDGETISIYVGRVAGILKPCQDKADDAFGFDQNFVPMGSEKSLYELEKEGRKDLFSARKAAIDLLDESQCSLKVNIDKIPLWEGSYQGEGYQSLEMELFDIATGDSLTKERFEQLSEQGLVERLKVTTGETLTASLTPKGDKLVREKLK